MHKPHVEYEGQKQEKECQNPHTPRPGRGKRHRRMRHPNHSGGSVCGPPGRDLHEGQCLYFDTPTKYSRSIRKKSKSKYTLPTLEPSSRAFFHSFELIGFK